MLENCRLNQGEKKNNEALARKMAALCDICFQVPSEATPRIQEGHEFIGHTLCALIESDMHPRSAV